MASERLFLSVQGGAIAARRPLLAVGLSLFGAAAVVTTIAASSSLALSVAVSGAVILLGSATVRIAGWRDPADVVLAYPLLLWTLFGLLPLLSRRSGDVGYWYRDLPNNTLRQAFALVLIGTLAFALGYVITTRGSRILTLADGEVQRVRNGRVLVAAVAVAGSRILLLLSGSYGYVHSSASNLAFSGPLGFVSQLSWVVILLAAVVAFSRNASSSSRVVLFCLLVVEAVSGVAAGMKGAVLLPFVAALLAFVYTRGKIPKHSIAIGIVLFLVMVSIVEDYRHALNRGGHRSSTGPIALRVLGTVEITPSVGRLSTSADLILDRVQMLDAFALIIEKTPSPVPFERGKYYLVAPAMNLVPRVLWPEKPVLNVAERTSRAYYSEALARSSASTRTIFGDLYANFGSGGVAVGMLTLGAIVGAVRRAFVKQRSLLAFVAYVSAIYLLLSYESDAASMIAGVPRLLIGALLVTRLLTRPPTIPIRALLPSRQARGASTEGTPSDRE